MQFNDITFALHALALSLVTASQYLARRAWGFSPSPGTRPSRFIVGISAGCLLALAVTYAVVAAAQAAQRASPPAAAALVDPAKDWCELDLVYAAGYVKLVVTLVKYTPQIVANWRNRSTDGWSIWQVLLDLVGGVLSTAQQGIDSYLQRDWSGITGNPVKFALGNASLLYDSIFMAQHYVVYRHTSSNGHPPWRSEEEPLLDDASGPATRAHDHDRRRRRLD